LVLGGVAREEKSGMLLPPLDSASGVRDLGLVACMLWESTGHLEDELAFRAEWALDQDFFWEGLGLDSERASAFAGEG
jgi:hypothetical protein